MALVAANTAVPLADLVDFDDGAYALDTDAIRHLVDSATTADPRYTPSTGLDHREGFIGRAQARRLESGCAPLCVGNRAGVASGRLRSGSVGAQCDQARLVKGE